jgi:hypothetical protein
MVANFLVAFLRSRANAIAQLLPERVVNVPSGIYVGRDLGSDRKTLGLAFRLIQ